MTCICVDVMGADKEPPVLLEGVAGAPASKPGLGVPVSRGVDMV